MSNHFRTWQYPRECESICAHSSNQRPALDDSPVEQRDTRDDRLHLWTKTTDETKARSHELGYRWSSSYTRFAKLFEDVRENNAARLDCLHRDHRRHWKNRQGRRCLCEVSRSLTRDRRWICAEQKQRNLTEAALRPSIDTGSGCILVVIAVVTLRLCRIIYHRDLGMTLGHQSILRRVLWVLIGKEKVSLKTTTTLFIFLYRESSMECSSMLPWHFYLGLVSTAYSDWPIELSVRVLGEI